MCECYTLNWHVALGSPRLPGASALPLLWGCWDNAERFRARPFGNVAFEKPLLQKRKLIPVLNVWAFVSQELYFISSFKPLFRPAAK